MLKVFDWVLQVFALLDTVHVKFTAGMGEGLVDPHMDAVIVANMNLDEEIGSSHDLKIRENADC